MPLENGGYSIPAPLVQFLDTNGDGTGVVNAIGNYSITAEKFLVAPPSGTIYTVNELLFHIGASGNFSAQNYAGIIGGLANGVSVTVERAGVPIFDILGGHPIKNNTEFGHLSGDFRVVSFAGGPDTAIVASLRSTSFETGLNLYGSLSDALVVSLNDDFTSLTDQHFVAHGVV